MAYIAEVRRGAEFQRQLQRWREEDQRANFDFVDFERAKNIKDLSSKGVVFVHLVVKEIDEEKDIVRKCGFNIRFPTTIWHLARNAIKYIGRDPSAFKITTIYRFDRETNEFEPRPIAPKNAPLDGPMAIPLKIRIEVEKSQENNIMAKIERYEKNHANDFFDENPPLVPKDFIACGKVLECGHPCGGIRNEEECQPCVICVDQGAEGVLNDRCPICQERIGSSPFIKIRCSHVFHFNCIRSVLLKRWNEITISFRFMKCPLCEHDIEHASLGGILQPLLNLRETVKRKALLRLEYEGLLNAPEITDETSPFYNKPDEYAMSHYKFVLCGKCKKPYFFGAANCMEQLDPDEIKPENFRCGGCSHTVGIDNCPHHGKEYIEYKCRYCCSLAVWFCFNTHHFCDPCHRKWGAMPKENFPECPVGPECKQLPKGPCPLGLQKDHPKTGEEFSLGCWMCYSIKD